MKYICFIYETYFRDYHWKNYKMGTKSMKEKDKWEYIFLKRDILFREWDVIEWISFIIQTLTPNLYLYYIWFLFFWYLIQIQIFIRIFLYHLPIFLKALFLWNISVLLGLCSLYKIQVRYSFDYMFTNMKNNDEINKY